MGLPVLLRPSSLRYWFSSLLSEDSSFPSCNEGLDQVISRIPSRSFSDSHIRQYHRCSLHPPSPIERIGRRPPRQEASGNETACRSDPASWCSPREQPAAELSGMSDLPQAEAGGPSERLALGESHRRRRAEGQGVLPSGSHPDRRHVALSVCTSPHREGCVRSQPAPPLDTALQTLRAQRSSPASREVHLEFRVVPGAASC